MLHTHQPARARRSRGGSRGAGRTRRLLGAQGGQDSVDLCVFLAPDAKIPCVEGKRGSASAPLLNQIRRLLVWFGFLIRIHSIYEIEVSKS